MMFPTLALLFLIGLALAYGVWRYLARFVSGNRIRNGLVALAVKELHDSAESMLKTPSDIPDRVLELLDFMLRTAFEKDTPRIFSRIAASASNGGIRPDARVDEDLNSMRPELQELFLKATASWLNIVCNLDAVHGNRIASAFNKIKVDRREVRLDEERETIAVLKRLNRNDAGTRSRHTAAAC